MRLSLAPTIFPLAGFAAAIPKPVVKSNGIAIKLTKHSPFPNPDNTIDIDVLNAHVASLSAKVLRGFDNYEKNTGTTHRYAVNRSGIRERGAGVPLMSNRAVNWYGEISIGTPPKTFFVEIDTGSSDSFLPWSLCDDSCDGHTLWDPDESSTAVKIVFDGLPKAFSLKYADDSSVSGIQYVDNVTIAGFTADKQTIGVAMAYSPQFHKDNWPADGMLGLAFESLSSYSAKPLFVTLVDDKVIEPVFSIKLTSNGGELYIGGADPVLYKGEFTYTPVTMQAHWQVELQSIQDGKGNVILTNVPAVIDTGATFIVGDPTRVSKMYKALGGMYVGDGYYSFRCNSFPTISLTFNGKSFVILPELLNIGKVSSGSNKCFSGIVAKDIGASIWLIGSTFLRGYYTTFEFGGSGNGGKNPRIGFAELR